MKKRNRWLLSLVAVSFPFSTLLISAPAHADSYHTVENGETLQSVASRYHLRAEALRSLNKLKDVADDDILPPMLLRIPDGKEKAPNIAKASEFSSSSTSSFTTSSSASFAPRNSSRAFTASSTSDTGSGVISKSFLYTVQEGDTFESIAARHTAAGYPVTEKAIRSKNAAAGALMVGRTLIIPVQSVVYNAPSETRSPQTDVAASQFQPPPLYTSPRLAAKTSAAPTSSTQSAQYARRGPTSLSYRGYSPSSGMSRSGVRLDGARVVDANEDASVTGTPLSKMIPRANASSRNAANPTAQVARISMSGARIRRLPEAGAITLYSCGKGTEIAVTQQKGAWSAILMSDRSTGWVPTKYLSFTGQNVDISSQIVASANSSSDTELRNDNGRWQSSNPMVAQALTWLGTPYVYGGEGRRGIDCSSLVQHSFAACGQRLPRTAAEQARVGTPVQPADLQPGDRLYFSASGTRIDHTGLYMGNGLFVHASGHGRQVMVSKLSEKRNWNIFVCARR